MIKDIPFIVMTVIAVLLQITLGIIFYKLDMELKRAKKEYRAELALKETNFNTTLERFYRLRADFDVNGLKIKIRLIPNSMHVVLETTMPDDMVEHSVIDAENFLLHSHEIIAENVARAVTYMRLKEPLKVPKLTEEEVDILAKKL